MNRLTWLGTLTFGVVVVFTGSSVLAVVLTLTTPTAAKVIVFAGGFFGTLLVGALIPGVRREVLGVFPQSAAPPEVAAAKPNLAPNYLLNQNTPNKMFRANRNPPESTYKYTHASTRKQEVKSLEK